MRLRYDKPFSDYQIAVDAFGPNYDLNQIKRCREAIYRFYEAGYAILSAGKDEKIVVHLASLDALENPSPEEQKKRDELAVDVRPIHNLKEDDIVWKVVSRRLINNHLRDIMC